MRLPRRRHRLAGRRAAGDRVDAARHGRHRRPARGHAGRLRVDDARAPWASGRPTSASASGRLAGASVALRQAGLADDRGPHRRAASGSTIAPSTTRPARGATRRRDYHVAISVPPGGVGDEMLAGRVSLVVDGEVVSQSLVKAIWTDDVAASTRINPQVAHYTGQVELAAAIAEGLEARQAGDDATATTRFGRAAQLAAETWQRRHAAAAGAGGRHRGCRHRDGPLEARRRRRPTRWRSTPGRPRPSA